MAIDFTKAAGQVRLLVSDVDEDNPILDDTMIAGFLARYGVALSGPPSPRAPINLAAADALDTIATSEALVGKVISTVDGLKTNGAALAESLRRRATTLREQAATDAATGDGEQGAYFGVVPFTPHKYTLEAAETPL